jgi:hypothetical protein
MGPAAAVSSVEVIIKRADLILMGHRPVAASEPVYFKAEPFVHDGAWYVWVRTDRNSTIDLLSRVVTGSATVYAQARMSLYPPTLSPAPAPETLAQPLWPVLTVVSPARPAFRMLAGAKLALESSSLSVGSIAALDRGRLEEVPLGEPDVVGYKVKDDSALNRAGPAGGKEIVLLAELFPKNQNSPQSPIDRPFDLQGTPAAASPWGQERGLEPSGDFDLERSLDQVKPPYLVSFSFEFFRNQALHGSRSGALAVLCLTVAAAAVFTVVYRRRFGFVDKNL